MTNKSKLVDLLKYFPNGKKDVDKLLIEYNNDIDKLYNDALHDVRARLIDNFFDPNYINSLSFGSLVRIFNNWDEASTTQLELRDRNEYEYFNK